MPQVRSLCMPTTHMYYYVLEHARALGEGAIY